MIKETSKYRLIKCDKCNLTSKVPLGEHGSKVLLRLGWCLNHRSKYVHTCFNCSGRSHSILLKHLIRFDPGFVSKVGRETIDRVLYLDGPDHCLKVSTVWFYPTWMGFKTFAIRENDRDFKTAQILRLDEYDEDLKMYTGNFLFVRINYILTDSGRFLKDGFVAMSIQLL